MSEPGHTQSEPVVVPAQTLAPMPGAAPAAGLTGLFSGFGNAAMARMIARQPLVSEEPAAAPGPSTSETWQHPEVRAKAAAIEKPLDKPKVSDRGLELCMELVPAVVKAVKGYQGADGRTVPLENAMLMITQAANEHAPYDPARLDEPVIPKGNMMWGVTSPGKKPGATVETKTDEESGGVRHSESNRSFRAYDTLDDAAMGYLRALEGSDADAATSKAFPKILDALKTPGMTPETFGKVLDDARYATAKSYGKDFAAHSPQTKKMVQRFMPQILSSLGSKIADIEAKQLAYHDLVGWIDTRIQAIEASLDTTGVLDDAGTAALQQEMDQLVIDRETALAAIENLNPEIAKAKQLMTDVGEFGATLGPAKT